MDKKGINFLEEHIEKLVLGLIGLLCLWLLFTEVVFSPNSVEYEGEKFDAGQIDNHILSQARLLERQLNRPPTQPEQYQARLDDYIAMLDSAIRGVDTSFYPPVPPVGSEEDRDDRKYLLPQVGSISDVKVGHIRAAAYVPTEPINEKRTYDQAQNEPNDIDFVTVEAKFDVAQLYSSFYDSFAGPDVRQDWRDLHLAKPVFAAVQLQRQQLLEDGSWGQWQDISRTKIDHRRAMFKVLEKINELPPGGLKVRLLQFDNNRVSRELLQPVAYQIASADEEWFPPLIYKKYVQRMREIETRERRQTKAAVKEQRERERELARAERGAKMSDVQTRIGTESSDEAEMYGESGGETGRARTTTTQKTRQERLRERGDRREVQRSERAAEGAQPLSTADIYKEFDEIMIRQDTVFSKTSEPFVLWSHDDTVEPGKSYRYRIRLGVFNPVAGTDRLTAENGHLRDNVILWSEFSDFTEPIHIPAILYFFPTDIQTVSNTVTVTVCKYILGYWYTSLFNVKPGEIIGEAVGYEPDGIEADVAVPEILDLSTGAMVLDIVDISEWSGEGSLRPRHFFEILYSFDGVKIERMPIRSRYWAADVQFKFNEIKRLERIGKKPFKAWGARATYREAVGGAEYGEGGEYGETGYGETGYEY